MKKRMAMAVMALAVSAMAGSAFAANEPSKAAPQNTVKAQLVTAPAISLEQMAKEKGISVEELIAQLEKEGKITKATKAMETFTIKPLEGSERKEGAQITVAPAMKIAEKDSNGVKTMKVISLEDMAKEQGITAEELIAKLQKEGKVVPATPLVPAAPAQN